jgi:hypothetical protein
LTRTKCELFNTISSQFLPESIDEIEHEILEWITPIIKKKKETQKKKINMLLEKEQVNIARDLIENTPAFYPCIQNLTDIEFDETENSLLEKSLKYNVNLDHRTKFIEDDLINLDVAIKKTKIEMQEPLKHVLIHEINKTNLEIKNQFKVESSEKEMKKINSIAKKLKDNDAIICKADKGNTTVVISNDEYKNKVQSFIDKNNFKNMTKDPTQQFSKVTNSMISNSKIIKKEEKYRLKVINPQAPKLRGQPKTHKPGIPMRPVVNFRTAPTYHLCKYLNKKIQEKLNWEQSFNVKNTVDLVTKIKDVIIPDNSIFISFDVKDMYSNIPPKETIKILEEDLRNNNVNNREIKDIISLTKTCCDQNYFEFNSKYYLQENGLAMGSPLSGLLSDIYMHNLEIKNICNTSNPYNDKIIYWHRYVDDIICLFNGTIEESKDFLSFLNTISPEIKFTQEIQTNEINYLDVTIRKNKNKHDFKIYRKPTQTDLLIPSKSNHPWQYKIAGFRSMINRMLSIPMTKHNFEEEKNIIKFLAHKNGYNHNLIDKIIKKTMKNKRKPKIENQNINYINVPHNTKLNKAIRKTFHNTNFQLSYTTKNNAFILINKKLNKNTNDNNENKYNKSGIYQIKCSDCNMTYIGQTGRSFTTRFKEHIQALKSNNKTSMKSTFAEHLLNTNHNYKNMEENLHILEFLKKGEKMDAKENLYIYLEHQDKPHNLLNTQIETNNPIYQKIRSIKMQNSS